MKFDDVKHEPLRSYNRCVMLFNIAEDSGMDAAVNYLNSFGPEDRKEMLDTYANVKQFGAEEVKRRIMISMPLQDDGVEHYE